MATVGILLMGACLRAPITAVGTLISQITTAYGLSATAAGMITTIPLVAFAVISPFVSSLGKKTGFGRLLLGGLLLLMLGICVRSFLGVAGLFAGTALMGVGIAVGNVLTPGVIKLEFPKRVGTYTGLYAVAMALSSGIAAAISAPVAATSLGWQGSLFLWIGLAAVAFLVWYLLRRGVDEGTRVTAPATANSDGKVQKTQSVYRSGMAWWITLLMGSQALVYYCFVAWLPTMLLGKGLDAAQAGYFTTYNQLIGLPLSFLIPILAGRLKEQKVLGAVNGILYLAGMGLFLHTSSVAMLVLSLGICGMCAGSANSLVTAAITLRASDAAQASDLAGMSQFLGYILAAVGPTLLGKLYDATGSWVLPGAVLLASIAAFALAGYMAGRDRALFPGKAC